MRGECEVYSFRKFPPLETGIEPIKAPHPPSKVPVVHNSAHSTPHTYHDSDDVKTVTDYTHHRIPTPDSLIHGGSEGMICDRE